MIDRTSDETLQSEITLTETEALLAEEAVAFRSRRDVLIAEGNDAAEYLHGQLSQNVTGLAVGASAWSLLLSPQGKVDAWLRVSRASEERFVLDLDEGFGEAAHARLKRFKLRVAVELTVSTVDWVAVRGPNAEQHRPASADLGADVHIVDLAWDDVDGTVVDGFDLFGANAAIPAGLAQGSAEAFEARRIELAIPKLGAEIVEKTIPAEVGVVDRSADFTKGCYVGQELVARVDSRGNNTPRSMRRMRIDATSDLIGSVMRQGGDEVGVVTSSALSADSTIVLASIKRAADLTAPFTVDTAEGEQAAQLLD